MKIIIIGSHPEYLLNFRGVLMENMVSLGWDVHACAPRLNKEQQAKLYNMGVTYHDINLDRTGMHPWRDLNTLFDLFRVFRRERPHCVLSYTIKPVIYGSLAARLAGVKNIASMVTGLGFAFTDSTGRGGFLKSVMRTLYRYALGMNKLIFFQNKDDMNDLFQDVSATLGEKRIVVINGSGVDIDHFSVTPLPVTPVFLLIARLLRDKGIYEYAAAARMVREQYPEARFKLVGWIDTNPASISEKDLEKWMQEGLIDHKGKESDVRPSITEASVYVLPSYREGTPRTVLEAMAMGRPIVTTDVPGCRETVIDGQNGFLVPPRNAIRLSEAMCKFIQIPGLGKRMGLESRCLAEERYDVRKVNIKICEELQLMDKS